MEISKGVEITVQKNSIATVLPKGTMEFNGINSESLSFMALYFIGGTNNLGCVIRIA